MSVHARSSITSIRANSPCSSSDPDLSARSGGPSIGEVDEAAYFPQKGNGHAFGLSASAARRFRLLETVTSRQPIPEEKMAVASNKPAAQPAAARRAAEQPAGVADFTQEQELGAYRHMLLIRRFEEKAGQLYGMGLIGGFCHLYIGQEAVVIGMQLSIKAGDKVITGYRDHGHMLACGMDPKGVMAELTGRAHGYSKGKGGSMHMFSVEKCFYGARHRLGFCQPISRQRQRLADLSG
jgi:hypothetical protein